MPVTHLGPANAQRDPAAWAKRTAANLSHRSGDRPTVHLSVPVGGGWPVRHAAPSHESLQALPCGHTVTLARYRSDTGPRRIVGQRLDGAVQLRDEPADQPGRVFVIENGLHTKAVTDSYGAIVMAELAELSDFPAVQVEVRYSCTRPEPAAMARMIADELARNEIWD